MDPYSSGTVGCCGGKRPVGTAPSEKETIFLKKKINSKFSSLGLTITACWYRICLWRWNSTIRSRFYEQRTKNQNCAKTKTPPFSINNATVHRYLRVVSQSQAPESIRTVVPSRWAPPACFAECFRILCAWASCALVKKTTQASASQLQEGKKLSKKNCKKFFPLRFLWLPGIGPARLALLGSMRTPAGGDALAGARPGMRS